MKLIKGISVVLIALGIIFLPTRLTVDTIQAEKPLPYHSNLLARHPELDSLAGQAGSIDSGPRSGMTSLKLLKNNDLQISLSLPFNTASNWISAPADIPSIKWQTGNTTTRFAVKNGKFISTDKTDTWFIYGWFGSIEAITKPYNIKYPRWENRHNGIDFAGREGLDIVSASGGIVTFVGKNIGNTVIVHVEKNYYITYGHLLDISVKTGNIISTGDLIGHLGNTGTTNPHLHFQVDKIEGNQKTAINPISLIDTDWSKIITPNADANKFYAGPSNPELQSNFTW